MLPSRVPVQILLSASIWKSRSIEHVLPRIMTTLLLPASQFPSNRQRDLRAWRLATIDRRPMGVSESEDMALGSEKLLNESTGLEIPSTATIHVTRLAKSMREQNRTEKRDRSSGQSGRRGGTRTRIQASNPGSTEGKTYPGVVFRFHLAPAGTTSAFVRTTKSGFQGEGE